MKQFKTVITIIENEDGTTVVNLECHNTPKIDLENRELALPDTPTGRFVGAIVDYAINLMETTCKIVGDPKITVISVDKGE